MLPPSAPPPSSESSNESSNPQKSSFSTRRRLAILGALVAVLIAFVGGLAGYAYSPDIPRGTSVLGVDIGGMDRTEAAAKLRSGVDAQSALDRPIKVNIGEPGQAREAQAEVNPDAVGLDVDVNATVAAAASRTPSFFGGKHEVAPTVTLDATKLDAALRPSVQTVAKAMTPPSITFDGLTPVATYGTAGRGLDMKQTTDAVKSAWPGSGHGTGGPVDLHLVNVDVAHGRDEVDKLMNDLAKPAVAAPVAVHSSKGDVTITPNMIAKSLKMSGSADGSITPTVDAGALRTAMGGSLSKIESSPESAVVGEGASAKVAVSAAGGSYVDGGKLATDVLGVLPNGAPRTVNATLNPASAQVNQDNLKALGVKEKVSTFTTKFTGGLNEPRVKNIVQVAKKVDGAVVKPGETFSLNGFTGVRGYEQGYVDAPVIDNNKLVPAVGGGISQFTTTLFNASYYAGLKDVEHKPHSFYISRYPSVIESTIFWPNLDLKFTNTTPHGILIDTSYTNNSITVSMWSTKVYDSVKTEWGPKRDVTKPESKKLPAGPQCIATSGVDGFSQDAYRVIRKDGKEVQREKFTWRYDAEPRYECVKPDPATDKAAPDQAGTDQQAPSQPAPDQGFSDQTGTGELNGQSQGGYGFGPQQYDEYGGR